MLIADTAGRLHTQGNLMEELKKVKRVLGRLDPAAPHEVLLVLDASQGQNALAQAQQFHEAVGVTGLVLTKLDGTAKGGIVLAIADTLKLPIRFIGVGETAEDFDVFDAGAFVDAVLARRDAPAAAPHDPLRSRLQTLLRTAARRSATSRSTSPRGEMVFLTGHSGAGKSTLLKLIALIERPTRGTLRRERPEHVTPCRVRRIPAFRRQIGVVFQDHKLLMDRPVYDNVGAAARDRGRAGEGNRASACARRSTRSACSAANAAGRSNCRPASSSASASRAPSSASRRC